MPNPEKDEFIETLKTEAEGAAQAALVGISGTAVLTDQQMRDAMQGVQDMLYTVAPTKGTPTIKIG